MYSGSEKSLFNVAGVSLLHLIMYLYGTCSNNSVLMYFQKTKSSIKY